MSVSISASLRLGLTWCSSWGGGGRESGWEMAALSPSMLPLASSDQQPLKQPWSQQAGRVPGLQLGWVGGKERAP